MSTGLGPTCCIGGLGLPGEKGARGILRLAGFNDCGIGGRGAGGLGAGGLGATLGSTCAIAGAGTGATTGGALLTGAAMAGAGSATCAGVSVTSTGGGATTWGGGTTTWAAGTSAGAGVAGTSAGTGTSALRLTMAWGARMGASGRTARGTAGGRGRAAAGAEAWAGFGPPFLTISTRTSRCSGSMLLSWFFTSQPWDLQRSTRSLLSTSSSRAIKYSRTFSFCKLSTSHAEDPGATPLGPDISF